VALGAGGGGAARAETPADVLVMADFIDDMISLDPAEAYEFSGLEAVAQFYDRIMTYPVDNVADLKGLVAESWSVSDDGREFTFKIRDGIKFHSGNALTAKDVEYSLRRVVALNKSPGFILTQFGFSAENMGETIKATDDRTLVLKLAKPYAPTFLLYCLTSGVASVVDSKVVEEHARAATTGYALAQDQLGRLGPFKLRPGSRTRAGPPTRTPTTGRARPLQARRRPPHPGDGTQRCCWRRATSTSPQADAEDLAAVGKSPTSRSRSRPRVPCGTWG
jgi:ABC-type transport system substrate-binding protein